MTTKADTSVKFGHSSIPDGPVLSGQSGALIALLDAFLIDGYCTRSVDSITVADGVATVTMSAGVPYPDHAVIALDGASPAALNDEWRIYDVGASTFKFNCPGIANGSATGTISAKMAPVGGWEKAFSDTNKAAYRSTDQLSNGFYMRVDDTQATASRVRGYEAMTGVDDGTNPFPTIEQRPLTDYVWMKSNHSNSTSRKWAAVADSRMLHFCAAFTTLYPDLHDFYRFGDGVALFSTDVYATEIVANEVSFASSPAQSNSAGIWQVGASPGAYVARGFNGASGAVQRVAIAYQGGQNPGFITVSADRLFYTDVTATTAASSGGLPRYALPGLRLGLNRPAASIDYHTHMVSGDVLLHVRAGTTINADLRYGAFSLAPEGSWR